MDQVVKALDVHSIKKLIVILEKSKGLVVTMIGHSFQQFKPPLLCHILRSECVVASASCPQRGKFPQLSTPFLLEFNLA